MKPRIFISIHYLEIGGAESSLIGLLEALDPTKVDIDLFVYSHQGIFMEAIPDYVNLLPEDFTYSLFEKPLTYVLKKGYWNLALARFIAKFKSSMFYHTHKTKGEKNAIFGYVGNEVSRVLPDLKKYGMYDLGISYVNPHNIVLDHVSAKKKIAWIHTDYSNISINSKLELPVWSGYDHIISISPDVTKGFVGKFSSLADKILLMENILPSRLIKKKATSHVELQDYKRPDRLTLCSVGRISYAKNYDNIPYIAAVLKKLMRAGHNSCGIGSEISSFRWYIVGPGNHDDIDALSEELSVKENVVFLGPSDNPYPYIKNCDIYVHPSRYEGKSIVVREAQVLGKPVIITDYPTAKSQIQDGVDGIICGMKNEEIASCIYSLSKDSRKIKELIRNLGVQDHIGLGEVAKIYKLVGK